MISAVRFRVLLVGAALAAGFGGAAEARSHGGHGGSGHHGGSGRHLVAGFSGEFHRARFASGYGHSGGGLQCVTFARADSGIELSGNARDWWDHAAGIYQRGARPEAGSVLNFRANGAMQMGHVAVVNQVVDSRTIEVDHANWGGPGGNRGGVSRDISVVDVSPGNDWSAVRVGLGHSGQYGSIYPTYGFIYNRPDRGTLVASVDHGEPIPAMNPAPRDLRGRVLADSSDEEVAEAPDTGDELAGPRHYRGHWGRQRHVVAEIGPRRGRARVIAVAHREHEIEHHRLHRRA